MADADSHALRVPSLAANEGDGAGVLGDVELRAPLAADDALGVVGDVVPALLVRGRRVLEGVPADENRRAPGAADARAASRAELALVLWHLAELRW